LAGSLSADLWSDAWNMTPRIRLQIPFSLGPLVGIAIGVSVSDTNNWVILVLFALVAGEKPVAAHECMQTVLRKCISHLSFSGACGTVLPSIPAAGVPVTSQHRSNGQACTKPLPMPSIP